MYYEVHFHKSPFFTLYNALSHGKGKSLTSYERKIHFRYEGVVVESMGKGELWGYIIIVMLPKLCCIVFNKHQRHLCFLCF